MAAGRPYPDGLLCSCSLQLCQQGRQSAKAIRLACRCSSYQLLSFPSQNSWEAIRFWARGHWSEVLAGQNWEQSIKGGHIISQDGDPMTTETGVRRGGQPRPSVQHGGPFDSLRHDTNPGTTATPPPPPRAFPHPISGNKHKISMGEADWTWRILSPHWIWSKVCRA